MWEVTSGFGETDPAHVAHAHQGIDFAMSMDTPIRAFESGVVTKVTHDPSGFGNAIWIKFNDGYTAVLGHLDKVYVKAGDHIYMRELIARSGNSGHSTGPHLHLGIMNPNGKWIDPSRYIDLEQVKHPAVLYGSGDWSHQLVASWFDAIGKAIGNGVTTMFHQDVAWVIGHMPIIVGLLLTAGGFLKMVGSKKWAPRLFVASVVGAGWLYLS